MIGFLRRSIRPRYFGTQCLSIDSPLEDYEKIRIPQQEPLLFTPGPLTTSLSTKQAMLKDYGSRDATMIHVIQTIRSKLLEIANVNRKDGYAAILLQGSGTYAVESVLGSVVGPKEKVLILQNGAYGARIYEMTQYLNIPSTVLGWKEDEKEDPEITHVVMIHHETTAGLLNPIGDIAALLQQLNPKLTFIVDAMSSFGAYPIDFQATPNIHYLIASANKNLESVPGISFVLCQEERLKQQGCHARSLSLDLLKQHEGFEKNGQFRLTPPTHTLLAFQQALAKFELEGGQSQRYLRYQANHSILLQGMQQLGFQPYLKADLLESSCIITTFYMPSDPAFDFEVFYQQLKQRGIVIYPGKITNADCFRIGTIGRIFPKDVETLLFHIQQTLTEMKMSLPIN